MSGKLNLKPSTLYFLRMVDDVDGRELPFVKVGITTKPIDNGVSDLQTGNPYRIVMCHHMACESRQHG